MSPLAVASQTSSNPAAGMGSNALRYQRKTGLGCLGGSGEVSGSGSGMGSGSEGEGSGNGGSGKGGGGPGGCRGPGGTGGIVILDWLV